MTSKRWMAALTIGLGLTAGTTSAQTTKAAPEGGLFCFDRMSWVRNQLRR